MQVRQNTAENDETRQEVRMPTDGWQNKLSLYCSGSEWILITDTFSVIAWATEKRLLIWRIRQQF